MKKVTIFGLLASLSALALPLAPGGSIAPPSVAQALPGTLVISSANGFSQGGLNGTITQAVYNNNGFYDFYYQVTGAAVTANITSILLNGFQSFSTDVSYFLASSPIGPFAISTAGKFPNPVSRTDEGGGAGDQLEASFSSPSTRRIGADQTSAVIVVRTNATGYRTTSLELNASGVFVNQFAPTPEPAFYGAITLGLAGLLVVRRRKNAAEVK